MPKENFKKKFLISLSVSVGAVFILLIINYFIFSDMGLRVKEIQSAKQEIAFRAKALDSLSLLKDDSRRAGEYYNALFKVLPTRDGLINFRRDFSSLASLYSVDAGFVFGADSAAHGERPGFAEFQATVSGKESSFLPFFKSTENWPYFVRFDSVDLNFSADKFNASIKGKVYSR